MTQKDDRDCSFIQHQDRLLGKIALVAVPIILLVILWYFLP